MPDNSVVFENRNLTLTCTTTAYPNLTFIWDYSDGTRVGGNTGSVSRSSTWWSQTLTFKPYKDKTAVRCQVRNTRTSATQAGSVSLDVKCPTNPQPLNAEYNMAGIIAGTTIGTLFLTLLVGGLVLTVFYRKGFRFGNVLPGTTSQKSTRNTEVEEMENIGYSSLDQINSPTHCSSLDKEASEKQHYTQLKIYENTNVEPKAETSTYEDMTEGPPASYESISASLYQNSGAQPSDPDYGNK